MLPVRSHDHHAAVWAHHAEYERRLHSLLDALPKDVAKQFIHFLVLKEKPQVFGLRSFLISRRSHGHFAAITMAALSTCFGRARRVSTPRPEKDLPWRSMRHAHCLAQ